MFTPSKSESSLDRAIAKAIEELDNHSVMSDEFSAALDRLAKLEKMKEAEKPSRRISPDTLIYAITNLIGIAMIIRHEHVNVITSKATNFVLKSKP